MSLHGTLETFALTDVMALLAATKKSGELRVVGGKLDGRVHLDAGKVVGADVGRADSFVDAVFELLRLTTGKFSFDADKAPSDPADPVDIEPLLLEAGARLTEWRGIEAVVPSMDHAVQLVADLGDPHVTLAADQWRMVVAVAGAACVHQVADRLGLGEYTACKSLKDLVESGVVLVADPPKAAAKPAPKAEPVAEKRPDPEPVAEPEPEPVAEPEPAPAAASKPAPEPAPEPEKKPEPKAEKKADAPVHIEPERKPDTTTGKVAVPALTTKDQTSPIPPGEEPGGAKAPKKPAAASTQAKADDAPAQAPAPAAAAATKPNTGVSASQAKALVSQLAAMSSEKPAAKAPAKPEEAPAADAAEAKAKDEKKTESAEAPADEAASAAEGDADEPLNRGLLLKFLSSVRQ